MFSGNHQHLFKSGFVSHSACSVIMVMLLWHVQLMIKIVICSRITFFFSNIWQDFWMQSSCYYKKKSPLTKHWIIYIQWIHWERTCVVIKTQIWIKAFKQFQPSHCNSNDFNTYLTKIVLWLSAKPQQNTLVIFGMHINRAVSLIRVSTQDHQHSFKSKSTLCSLDTISLSLTNYQCLRSQLLD